MHWVFYNVPRPIMPSFMHNYFVVEQATFNILANNIRIGTVTN